MINIAKLSHDILNKHPNPRIAVDMTCGLGRDTLFLADIAQKVYAFDIQEAALMETAKLLSRTQKEKVRLIHASHHLFADYIDELIDLAIYNLGYLPGGQKDILTDAKTVLCSLKRLLERLNNGGLVVMVIYLHDSSESDILETYTRGLDARYDVMRYQVLNKTNCPLIISIQKTK